MEITRNGSQPSTRGPAGNFTGSVRVDWMEKVSEEQYRGVSGSP